MLNCSKLDNIFTKGDGSGKRGQGKKATARAALKGNKDVIGFGLLPPCCWLKINANTSK